MQLNSLLTFRLPPNYSFPKLDDSLFSWFQTTSQWQFFQASGYISKSLLLIHSKPEYPRTLLSFIPLPVLPTLVVMLFSAFMLFLLLGCSFFISIPGKFTLQSPASPTCLDSEALFLHCGLLILFW